MAKKLKKVIFFDMNKVKKSFWETLKFWNSNSKFALHPEILYRPAIIDFNQKKVGVFNKKPQLVNGKNQFNGFVAGTLKKFGKHVYLAAFDSGLTCGDYQRVCLDESVENLAFHVSKSVYETFSSNFKNSDLRLKWAYCDNTDSSVPNEEDLVLANERPLTFRKAKYEELSVLSKDTKLWLWVAFDAEGNMLDPHEYVSWKPYEYTLKYEYVSATGKYLYHDCDYSGSDWVLALKKKYTDFCGVIRHKKTGELGMVRYVDLGFGAYSLWYDILKLHLKDGANSLRYDILKLLLKDEDVAKKLEGRRVWAWNIGENFIISHGKLRATELFLDTCFTYYNLKGEKVAYHDYEIVDPDNDTKYFVCGMMRQKSSSKTFYLAMCNGKQGENYFALSAQDLKTLLKDDKVAEQFEGKSFMVSEKGGKCYQISNRKLQPIFESSGANYFILRDENGIFFEEGYNSSDWEILDPKSYVKPQKVSSLKSDICGKIQHEKSGETYFLKMFFDDKKYTQKEIFKEYDGLGLLLPLEELQKLLKNEKFASKLEGKTFWSYLASDENHKFIEAYEVSKGELKRLMLMEAQGNFFQLINEKGVLVTDKFEPSEWKVVEPEKTA